MGHEIAPMLTPYGDPGVGRGKYIIPDLTKIVIEAIILYLTEMVLINGYTIMLAIKLSIIHILVINLMNP